MGLLAYAIAGIALVGALMGAYYKVHHDGYLQGTAEVRNDWDAANRKAQAEQEKLDAQRRAEATEHATALATATATAADYQSRWRAANAANRKPLATCERSAPANPTALAGTGVPDSGPLTLRLSAEFVRQYDSAWTNKAGQPVFGDTGIAASEAGGAVTPEEVIANHGENAARCSADRARQDALIDLIVKLRGG